MLQEKVQMNAKTKSKLHCGDLDGVGETYFIRKRKRKKL
jgi:hypothetical protein